MFPVRPTFWSTKYGKRARANAHLIRRNNCKRRRSVSLVNNTRSRQLSPIKWVIVCETITIISPSSSSSRAPLLQPKQQCRATIDIRTTTTTMATTATASISLCGHILYRSIQNKCRMTTIVWLQFCSYAKVQTTLLIMLKWLHSN